MASEPIVIAGIALSEGLLGAIIGGLIGFIGAGIGAAAVWYSAQRTVEKQIEAQRQRDEEEAKRQAKNVVRVCISQVGFDFANVIAFLECVLDGLNNDKRKISCKSIKKIMKSAHKACMIPSGRYNVSDGTKFLSDLDLREVLSIDRTSFAIFKHIEDIEMYAKNNNIFLHDNDINIRDIDADGMKIIFNLYLAIDDLIDIVCGVIEGSIVMLEKHSIDREETAFNSGFEEAMCSYRNKNKQFLHFCEECDANLCLRDFADQAKSNTDTADSPASEPEQSPASEGASPHPQPEQDADQRLPQ